MACGPAQAMQVERNKNSFFGLSTLREQEKVVQGPSEKQLELQKYLASKYASGAEPEDLRAVLLVLSGAPQEQQPLSHRQ